MNTNPDDVKLAMWLEDELSGEELAAFEASVDLSAELAAQREQIRQWKSGLAVVMPTAEELPYPDFFNSRLEREVRELERESERAGARPAGPRRGFSWQGWLMPLTACAGMVFAFWLGAQTGNERSDGGRTASVPAPAPLVAEPVVYTPEQGVRAEFFASDDASATVVVLEGVAAIPDSIDFSETAAWSNEREMDSTAGIEDGNDERAN